MVRFQALAVILGVLWVPLLAADDETLDPAGLNPSARCNQCHLEIYSMWKRSMHGGSSTDPIFETSYLRAYAEAGEKARNFCFRCHAPGVSLVKGKQAGELFRAEGIPCDFCHSVVSVDLQKRDQPFTVKLDGIKRGPLRDAESPVHEVARSPLHETAEFCAGCHEYTNGLGVPIFSTYTEWKGSPQAAEGKTCQNCHMPLTPGATVRPGLGSDRRSINLHDISGGHSRDQVVKAAKVRIINVRRENASTAAVEVEVANVGSGHSIPTGLPTRKIVLEVILFADNHEVRRFERRYQKRLLDASGNEIVLDHRTLLNAHKVLEDNRLMAGEHRIERFSGSVPGKGSLRVEAKLTYVYQPEIVLRQQMSIEMTSDTYTP